MTDRLNTIKDDLLEHISKRINVDHARFKAISCPYPLTLLGTDSDIMGGKSLSLTLDIYTTLLFFPDKTQEIRLYVKEVPGLYKISLDHAGVSIKGDWLNPLKGAVNILKKKYYINTGFTSVLSHPFPGSMDTKPAIFQILTILALVICNRLKLSSSDLTDLCEEIDSDYLNEREINLDPITLRHSNSQIMQYVDFNRSKMKLVRNSNPADIVFTVLNTGEKFKTLLSSEEKIIKLSSLLSMMDRGDNDANPFESYESFKKRLPEELVDIGEFYRSEQKRIVQASNFWKANRLYDFGTVVSESAISRTDDRNVINKIENLKLIEGVYGIQVTPSCDFVIVSDRSSLEKVRERASSILRSPDLEVNSGELCDGLVIY